MAAAKAIRIKKKTDTSAARGTVSAAKPVVVNRAGVSNTSKTGSAAKRVAVRSDSFGTTSAKSPIQTAKRVVVKKAAAPVQAAPKTAKRVVVKKAAQPVVQTTAPKAKRVVVKKASSSGTQGQTSSRYDDYSSSYYGGGIGALRASRPSYSESTGSGVDTKKYLESQNALIDAQINALLGQINAAKSTVTQQADDAARQAYINLKSSENALPQTLSAAGQSGGMAQSALLGLYTNYERSRNDIQRDRMNQLAEIDNTMTQAKASGDIQKAQAALDLQKEQMEQDYQKELLRMKAEQQQALSWQQHLQDMDQITARNSMQRSRSLMKEVEEELMLSEAFESLASSGDIDGWQREYAGILDGSQMNWILRQYQG